jgi:hypothetical protein
MRVFGPRGGGPGATASGAERGGRSGTATRSGWRRSVGRSSSCVASSPTSSSDHGGWKGSREPFLCSVERRRHQRRSFSSGRAQRPGRAAPKARGARPRATGEPQGEPGGVRLSAKPGPWARFSFSARPRRERDAARRRHSVRRATGREDRKGRRGGRRDHASADACRHEDCNVLEPLEEGPPQSGPHSRPQRSNASEGQVARAPLLCRPQGQPVERAGAARLNRGRGPAGSPKPGWPGAPKTALWGKCAATSESQRTTADHSICTIMPLGRVRRRLLRRRGARAC